MSERVWCVDETFDRTQLLTLVMNGPGLDRHSGVWVKRVPGWIDMARMFAFDFVYLDQLGTVVKTGSVGPAQGFPALDETVAGTLILANRRVAETGTGAGDQVKISEQGEPTVPAKAASHSVVGSDPMESGKTPPPLVPGESYAAPTTAQIQVSRYSGFVFEPFYGSLVYLPNAEAPMPQSSEYFLPEPRPGQVQEKPLEWTITNAPEPSAKNSSRGRRQTGKDAVVPQDEPHFYTPKPIRFFDPATGEASAAEPLARPSTHLSAELKAAIQRMDEQLRHEKELLERGKKIRPKEKIAKPLKKKPSKPVEAKSQELAPAEPVIGAEREESEVLARADEASPLEPDTEVLSAIEAAQLQIEAVPQPEEFRSRDAEMEIDAIVPAGASPIQESVPETRYAISDPACIEPARTAPATVRGEETRPTKTKRSLGERLQKWIGMEVSPIADASSSGSDLRRGERFALPGLVAFYWSGGSPRPHEIVNISKSGFYLRTKEIWLPDTLVRMTLQRTHSTERNVQSISVLARVVRIGEDGVGHQFVMTEVLQRIRIRDVLPERGTERKELERFLELG